MSEQHGGPGKGKGYDRGGSRQGRPRGGGGPSAGSRREFGGRRDDRRDSRNGKGGAERGPRHGERRDGGKGRGFDSRRDGAKRFDDRRDGKRGFGPRRDDRRERGPEERKGFDGRRDDRRNQGFEDRRGFRGGKERPGNARDGRFGEREKRPFGEKRPSDKERPFDKERSSGDRRPAKGRLGDSGRSGGKAERFEFGRSKATPARLAALEAVRIVRERKAFASDVIDSTIDRSSLTPEDRAFATRLVLGSVSSEGTLDEVIDRVLDDPHDISPLVRDAVRLSTYEILFLDKRFHAAVDQGVEMVRAVAPPAAGVANYILRNIVRQRSAFPFGDPTQDLEALARLQAFPTWLAALLMKDLGPQEAVRLMQASNRPAPLYVSVNALKTREELVRRVFDRLEEPVEHVAIDGLEVEGCLRVEDPRTLLIPEVGRLLKQGRLVVSDAASQLVAASVLPDEKPSSVLEAGAGRGTKTVLLQSEAQRRWGSQIETYVTLDNRAFKTKLLEERAEQCGAHVSEALTGDALHADELTEGRLFDLVFLDAPCSGLGTLRRHPEIRWRLKLEEIVEMARLQLSLLRALAGRVSPGGTLAYATCTVTHVECNGVVKAFLESEEGADFRLAPIAGGSCVSTRLSEGSPDAHFAVRFVREGKGA